MKYIIKESQAKNYVRRRLNGELFFEYIKEACGGLIGTYDNDDDFLYYVVHTAVTDFLYDEGFIEEALSEEIAQEYYDQIFEEENAEILEYILEFYEKYNDVDEDDEDVSFEDLIEK